MFSMTNTLTTDLTRSDAFLNAHGHRIRYSPDMGKWFIWDGKRWKRDTLNRIGYLARRSGLSSSDRGQDAFLRQAAKEVAIVVPAEQWDANPWLLACENVTVDLRTGAVRQPEPEDLNTKLANVTYDATATYPRWEKFLLQIMNGSQAKDAYLQRLQGYCLTGSVQDAILPFFVGDGANGKSTLLRVIENIMGDYAGAAPEGLLLAQKYQGHPTDIASLMGKRLVIASEMPPGRKLDVARVKQLTGGDTISARFMYGNPFTFRPTHKIIVQCNHLPRMGDATSSAWRRVQRIDFPVVIPEWDRDPELDVKLMAEASGILNWLMAGAVQYVQTRLRVPPEIAEATEQYRQADDVNAAFFDDCVEISYGEEDRVSNAELLAAYNRWADRNVAFSDRWSQHDLYRQAEIRGATRGAKWNQGRTRGFKGLKLARAAEAPSF
jgi:putative DNA primase/helicase